MRKAGHTNIDVVSALHLAGRDNDLHRLRIVCSSDGVVQNADGSHHTADRASFGRIEVGWITNNDVRLGDLIASLDTPGFAVGANKDLVDALVEHESAAVNGAQSREALGKASKTIQRIDIRTLSVSLERVHIKLNSLGGGGSRLIEVVIIAMQGHCMASEGLGVGVKTELLVQLSGGHLIERLAYKKTAIIPWTTAARNADG